MATCVFVLLFGAVTIQAERRDMHIRAAKERLERLERLKIEAEEKRRVRDALRAKKRADKVSVEQTCQLSLNFCVGKGF